MSDTLPGELRYDPREQCWCVRCVACPERWLLGRRGIAEGRPELGELPETAARYLTERGWRCLGARWCCPGCAL